MDKKIKHCVVLFIAIASLALSIGQEQEINRPFKQAGSIEALIDKDINYNELILVQLDLTTDSLLTIVQNTIPQLDLNIGLGSYHRILPIDIFYNLQSILSPNNYRILKRDYELPNQNRQYWSSTLQGNQTMGTYTEDDAISYTCDCVDGASDCVKLGWYSWYNPFDYYGEAWWGFTPPEYSYIDEIRVTVRGAQCDLLPLSSETYMGMKDDNGNWAQNYQLSIDYTDNTFIVPDIFSLGMLIPTIGSEDNYVVDQITLEFFYICLYPDNPTNVISSDEDYCDYVDINWLAPDNANNVSEYRIYRDGEFITEVNNSTFNFMDYSASLNIAHEYCLSSVNECGESNISCDIGSRKGVSPVNNVNASDGVFSDYVYITWTPSDNADLYKVYRDGIWLGITDANLSPEYSDYFIDYEFEHEYCIESINDCGASDWICDIGYGAAGLGDINNDTSIDVLDVVLLVNIILGYSEPTDNQFWTSDINSDNQINVQDVILLVSIILD